MTSGTAGTSTSRASSRVSNSPKATSDATRRRMRATPRRDTPCELAIRSLVHRQGLRYRVDWRIPETRKRADLAFVSARVLVLVDGCFWHGCPRHATWPKANADWWRAKIEANIRRDREATELLRRAGWVVLRFWEHEPPLKAAARIAKTVARRLEGCSAKTSATGGQVRRCTP